MQAFKLTIELVPQTSWYANLRNAMPKAQWDRLRKQVYAKYNYRCGVCGASNTRLNCHEIWDYDEHSHVQTLLGFIALCDLCHHVKHIGLAGILAARGQLDYQKVVEHFLAVNKCDRTAFEAHRKWAFEQWVERSTHDWQVELGEYANLIVFHYHGEAATDSSLRSE